MFRTRQNTPNEEEQSHSRLDESHAWAAFLLLLLLLSIIGAIAYRTIIELRTSGHVYRHTLGFLVLMFGAAIALLFLNFYLLRKELQERRRAEQSVRASEEALRHLSASLLKLQDDERRRLSRELHDSLGQYLASLKMNLDLLRNGLAPPDGIISESIRLLDQLIVETRILSYLMHPPLLDEVGFASAAKWYVDEFVKRSGIEVNLEIPEEVHRLPAETELVLFRVLQESLTNIHRHARSSTASIGLKLSEDEVVLRVRDCGKGMPPEALDSFRTKGINVGVGLAGMRERIRELGGKLQIQSDASGTEILANIPLSKNPETAGAND